MPLSAAGLRHPDDDKRKRLKDCRQAVGADGFLCHYLEPQASDPGSTTTRAALLAPVVDLLANGAPCRVALFGNSVEPGFFQALQGASSRAWRMGRRVRLKPGETQVVKAFLLLHEGDATEAWRVFRQFGHREDYPAIAWPRDVRVHYFDFLSSREVNGPRGGGYDLDLEHLITAMIACSGTSFTVNPQSVTRLRSATSPGCRVLGFTSRSGRCRWTWPAKSGLPWA